MKDWVEKLDGFLTLNDRDILSNAGRVSHAIAISKAEEEYDSFNAKRIAAKDAKEDDFERTIKSLPAKAKRRKN
jgi:hypothetical protein